MHYYKHHIGDYRRDTGHLSLLEHGVYRQLLDWYYLDESPIPNEPSLVYRKLSARSEAEMAAVDAVLLDFFTKTDAGWVNGRCSDELIEYHGKNDKNRVNGKTGGRPKKTQVVSVGFSDETQTVSNDNPNITLTINHKPLTTNQEPNIKTPNSPLSDKPKGSGRMTLETWLSSLTDGEKAIPENDPIFDYAENAGIPIDFLRLYWIRFRDEMRDNGKLKSNWRQHFRNAVKGNWYKLWYFDSNGNCSLTTAGFQQQKVAA